MNGHVPCQDPLAELCGQFEVAVYIQKRESRHTPVASKEHQFKGTPAVVVWQTMFVHGHIVHWGLDNHVPGRQQCARRLGKYTMEGVEGWEVGEHDGCSFTLSCSK